MCAYLLNTVLFLIAGCYLGDVLQRFVHGNDDDGVVHTDISFLIILYLVCIFARAIAILVCYPALRRLGTGMQPRTAVVLLWGGLRGAVGLALALIVLNETETICERVRQKVLFHSSGIGCSSNWKPPSSV